MERWALSKVLDQNHVVRRRSTPDNQLFAIACPGESVDVIGFEIGELLSRATINWLRKDICGHQRTVKISYRATVRHPPHDAGIGARRQIDEFSDRPAVQRQNCDLP